MLKFSRNYESVLCTSDEDDAETLQLFLEQAYTGSPTSLGLDPAQTSSLLLFDKDFVECMI